MRNKTLKLGVAAAAALMLPLGLVSPAFAESGSTLNSGPNDQTTAQEKDALVAAQNQAEVAVAPQGAAEGSVSLDENSGTSAPLVSGSFGGMKITAIPLLFSPAGAGTTYKTTKVSFNGPAVSSNVYYSMFTQNYDPVSASIVTKNPGVLSKWVIRPSLDYPLSSGISPTKESTVRINSRLSTTPGVYKLTVPLTKSVWNTRTSNYDKQTIVGTKLFTISAHPNASRADTSLYGYAYPWQNFPISITAPEYQSGAGVTVYYKASGTTRYSKVATGTLKAYKGLSSKATVSIPGYHNAGGRNGSVYVRVNSVPYAPAYSTFAASIS